jgi:hypothetical protein
MLSITMMTKVYARTIIIDDPGSDINHNHTSGELTDGLMTIAK